MRRKNQDLPVAESGYGTEPDGVIRARLQFKEYDEWPDTLAGDIETFQQVYAIAPNLLAACWGVFVAMDEAA